LSSFLFAVVAVASLLLLVHGLCSLYLMLYSWQHPDRLEASRGPETFTTPWVSFSVLLPARHEEAVIGNTIRSIVTSRYPRNLIEVLVICERGDQSTITEAKRAIADIATENVRILTFNHGRINKPHALNVGLQHCTNDIVCIFDAEDDIHPDIFNLANTVVLKEKVVVVQLGVQLMNFLQHWFSLHNCVEYFLWFKSRLHLHARMGMIPLGGNTVFIRRELLEELGGWDEDCLTEDAEMGVRLSILGHRIRVVYDPSRVTREETPHSLGGLMRQRTRWQQGFIQVLRKREWTNLPLRRQRWLAAYTFSQPLLDACLVLLIPASIVELVTLKLPLLVAMVSFLPIYTFAMQMVVTIASAAYLTREHAVRTPWLTLARMSLTFGPYQFVLAISALRAVIREVVGSNNWEKTAHTGAHRSLIQIEDAGSALAMTPSAPPDPFSKEVA
jgi:cellulose synthase/poly-beta-1,6-N-acetylglucosamine synthase-like glycosyltransferase